MELNWIKDRHGNRVASLDYQGRKLSIKAYTSGAYEALCILGRSVFGRISTTTYFSGIANSILQAQTLCEEKLDELMNKRVKEADIASSQPIPTINVENNICTISVPGFENVEIRYTVNGKDVKRSNKVYKEPFEVTEDTIIKAVAYIGDITSVQVVYPEEK